MKKFWLIILILVMIGGVWFVLRFVIGGSENTWICEDGQWVKHGNPRDPMPIKGCGEEQQLNIQKNSSREAVGTNLVKELILLDVPFTAQALFGQWSDPIYQNACEEASLLMAILWVRGIKSISKEEATLEIRKLVEFSAKGGSASGGEIEKYNNFYDHSAKDTAQIMRDYFGYNNIELKNDISVEDIKTELLNGNLVIVPINGRKLGNPFYTPPGPLEHMLVIIGYDFNTKEFITNDAGTRHGEKYRYKENVLENALQDYPTGYKELITEIKKVMLVIKK